MSYDKYAAWNNVYANKNPIAYPPEGLIRVFLGEFPKLKFSHDYKNKSICDVGFGDGRNFPLFDRLGLRVSGVEITEDIVHAALTRDMFKSMNLIYVLESVRVYHIRIARLITLCHGTAAIT